MMNRGARQPTPQMTMTLESHDTTGIDRITMVVGLSHSSAFLDIPINSPTGVPIIRAIPRPSSALKKVMKRAGSRLPSTVSERILSPTSSGDGRISGSEIIVDRIHQPPNKKHTPRIQFGGCAVIVFFIGLFCVESFIGNRYFRIDLIDRLHE